MNIAPRPQPAFVCSGGHLTPLLVNYITGVRLVTICVCAPCTSLLMRQTAECKTGRGEKFSWRTYRVRSPTKVNFMKHIIKGIDYICKELRSSNLTPPPFSSLRQAKDEISSLPVPCACYTLTLYE
jgi:hypothetical protein